MKLCTLRNTKPSFICHSLAASLFQFRIDPKIQYKKSGY